MTAAALPAAGRPAQTAGIDVTGVDLAGRAAQRIRDVQDYPSPGVVFKDITPLLADVNAFRFTVDAIADHFAGQTVDKVLGIEARGFIAAAPVAYRFGAGFVPVRKAGKLPWEVEREEYVLEYGSDLLEIHRDAVAPGEKVLIVDDVMATGGTAEATIRLVETLGGEIVGLGFILELAFLGGRERVKGRDVLSLLTYE